MENEKYGTLETPFMMHPISKDKWNVCEYCESNKSKAKVNGEKGFHVFVNKSDAVYELFEIKRLVPWENKKLFLYKIRVRGFLNSGFYSGYWGSYKGQKSETWKKFKIIGKEDILLF
jgi:hypothetical protein